VSLGLSYVHGYLSQWDQNSGVLDRAAELAEKAVALDDSNSTAHALLGMTAAYKRQEDKAVTNSKRTVSLGPNDAFAWVSLAQIMNLAGKPEEALTYAQKATRLDPRHQVNYSIVEGHAYNSLRRFEKAIAAYKAGDQADPWTHVGLIYAYSELSREQDARTEATEVMRLSPHFSLDEMKQTIPGNWYDPWHQHYLAQLRKAGLK
jgi:tetratricopeptide (TPR) repeat protein